MHRSNEIAPIHKKEWFRYSILLLCIGIFQCFMLLPGHPWGDDFALYILQAKNIAGGHLNAPTGFIPNPEAPIYSPGTYPIGFPLLLAPVYAVFGLNFTAFKMTVIICFLLFLLAQIKLLQGKLPPSSIIAVILLQGLSTGTWVIMDNVISDIPAACIILWTFVYLDKWRNTQNKFYNPVIFSLLIVLSYLFRPTGLLVFVCWAAYQVKAKQFSKSSLLITTLLIIIILSAITFITPASSGGYIGLVLSSIQDTSIPGLLQEWTSRGIQYISSIAYLSYSGDNPGINIPTIANVAVHLTLMLAFLGGILSISARRQFPEYLIFSVIYCGILIVYPGYQTLRYLFPILPLYFYFAAVGYNKYVRTKIVAMALSGILLFITIRFFLFFTDQYKTNRINNASATTLFSYINTHIPKDDIIMCERPRAITLMTGVRCTSFPDPEQMNNFSANLVDMQSAYILTSSFDYHEDIEEKSGHNLELLFSNEDFSLYAVKHAY